MSVNLSDYCSILIGSIDHTLLVYLHVLLMTVFAGDLFPSHTTAGLKNALYIYIYIYVCVCTIYITISFCIKTSISVSLFRCWKLKCGK